MNESLARLDKSGFRVLCFRPECGATLAEAIPTGDRSPDGRWLRELTFPPGWLPRPEDGVWALTKHAARRVRQGKPPAFKRPPAGIRDGGGQDRGVRARRCATTLPVHAECPACGAVQLLSMLALRSNRVVVIPATVDWWMLKVSELPLPLR